MTNRPKAIGTAAETAVVAFLQSAGATSVERIALSGVLDRGDVHYRSARGRLTVVSVKGGKMAETASPELIRKWLHELDGQADRVDPSAPRFLVTKRAGVGAKRAELWRAHALNTPASGVWSADLDDMVALLDLFGTRL